MQCIFFLKYFLNNILCIRFQNILSFHQYLVNILHTYIKIPIHCIFLEQEDDDYSPEDGRKKKKGKKRKARGEEKKGRKKKKKRKNESEEVSAAFLIFELKKNLNLCSNLLYDNQRYMVYVIIKLSQVSIKKSFYCNHCHDWSEISKKNKLGISIVIL